MTYTTTHTHTHTHTHTYIKEEGRQEADLGTDCGFLRCGGDPDKQVVHREAFFFPNLLRNSGEEGIDVIMRVTTRKETELDFLEEPKVNERG